MWAEFGADGGKRAIIIWALYGIKSAISAFIIHLYQCMSDLGYSSLKADPDVWMRAYTKPDGTDFMNKFSCILAICMYNQQTKRGDRSYWQVLSNWTWFYSEMQYVSWCQGLQYGFSKWCHCVGIYYQ